MLRSFLLALFAVFFLICDGGVTGTPPYENVPKSFYIAGLIVSAVLFVFAYRLPSKIKKPEAQQ